MTDTKLTLTLLPDTLAICRLEMESEIPPWALTGGFSSITRTAEELSVVCSQEAVPVGVRGSLSLLQGGGTTGFFSDRDPRFFDNGFGEGGR
jgi:hypothetical protein